MSTIGDLLYGTEEERNWDLGRGCGEHKHKEEKTMSTNSNGNNNNLPEAAVSWNTRYISPQGFECQLTLRGGTLGEVMAIAVDAMNRMLKSGCKPVLDRYHIIPPTSNNGAAKPAEPPADPAFCTIHKVQMTKHEKNGGSWYSHKTADGQWCRGK